MIGRISRFMTRFVSRWLPDPLIFAMLLTLLTFVIALWLTPQTPISMVKMWGDGFWNLLAFGMQMALIIVTGHALASSVVQHVANVDVVEGACHYRIALGAAGASDPFISSIQLLSSPCNWFRSSIERAMYDSKLIGQW